MAISTVYVVGAGFSTEFGYPTARELLPRVWRRMDGGLKKKLKQIIIFHHPGWDGRSATLPEIEEMLTELSANEELLPTLRSKGKFTVEGLRAAREALLVEIATWFHEIHLGRKEPGVLQTIVDEIRSSRAAVISFNWDYELDKALFDRPTSIGYGLSSGAAYGAMVLKPHGSLNWYPAKTGQYIKDNLRETLWSEGGEEVYCFVPWRAPKSERRQYVPWIVPPTHLKDFRHPMFKRIWRRCVEVLSIAKRVYFLGYSLPPADWHARYILRAGFHNQVEGLPVNGSRRKPTGKATVYVVNPDPTAFRRIEPVVGWHCRWVPGRVGQWVERSRGSAPIR